MEKEPEKGAHTEIHITHLVLNVDIKPIQGSFEEVEDLIRQTLLRVIESAQSNA